MLSFINPGEMPRYLNAIDFDLWLNNFIKDCDVIGLNRTQFRPNLDIEFSDKLKTQDYGSYSIDEIKDMIRQKWNINQEIEEILEGVKDYSDYRHGEYERLAGAIRDNNPNTNYHDIKEKIDGWFDNIAFSTHILGEYINAQKKIILYTKNIENECLAGRTAKQNFEKVFIHELFHAYHYCPNSHDYDKEELVRRCDYTSKVVKESLASAFEWHYCVTYSILGADDLQKSWENHSVWSYPYSGAANIVNYNWRINAYSIDCAKFIDVFNKSIIDMDGALRILLPADDFYDIKNAVSIRNKIIKKPIPIISKTLPKVFVVKNSKSFSEESFDNYLFTPDKPYYNPMKSVQKGDLILHIFKDHLHAISIAKDCCYYSNDSHNRHECGCYIDSAYEVFDSPVDIGSFKTHPHYPNKQGDPHYILQQKNLDIIELVLQRALADYPNNATIQLIKAILS